MNEKEKAKKVQEELEMIDYYKRQILQFLDGEVLTAEVIAEKLGLDSREGLDNKYYNYYLRALDSLQKWHPKSSNEPSLKLAIKPNARYSETYLYYRTDQEEKLVKKGDLSKEVRKQEGMLSLKELYEIL